MPGEYQHDEESDDVDGNEDKKVDDDDDDVDSNVTVMTDYVDGNYDNGEGRMFETSRL